jgi:hypothetical protein
MLSYLDWDSLLAAGIASKELNKLATSDGLWRDLAMHHWPNTLELELPSFRRFCLARLQQRSTKDQDAQTTADSLTLLFDCTIVTKKGPCSMCSKAVPLTVMQGGSVSISWEADWELVVKPMLLGQISGPLIDSALVRADSKVMKLPTSEKPDACDGGFRFYSQPINMSQPWYGETEAGPCFEAEWNIQILTAVWNPSRQRLASKMTALLQFNVYWDGGDVTPIDNQQVFCALDVAQWA